MPGEGKKKKRLLVAIPLCVLLLTTACGEKRQELEPDEIADFVALVPELEIRDGQSGQRLGYGGNYAFVCLDENGDALYTFVVDFSRNLNMEDKHLWHNDELVEFCNKLEDKYGLDVSENLDRNPGPEYFNLTDRIAKIHISEYTETNFDEGVEYTYTEEEVSVGFS